MSQWSVYVVKAADDSLYTGIATDVARRLREHNEGRIGARYLRGRTPVTLLYQQALGDRSLASRAEYAIKRLSRQDKLKLVRQAPDAGELLQTLAIEQPVGEHHGVDHTG